MSRMSCPNVSFKYYLAPLLGLFLPDDKAQHPIVVFTKLAQTKM